MGYLDHRQCQTGARSCRHAFAALLSSVLVACGGGGGGGGSTSGAQLPNGAPVISGAPPTTVQVGSAYVFQPGASDPDGDALSFSIGNKPGWLTFDPASGALSGNPGSADVGTYAQILIAVSDGDDSASLPAFSITVAAAPTTPPGGTTNQPPTITGTPPTRVTAGQAYSFQPAASDPDGDALSFFIVNRPVWATFNGQTGRLTGTPGTSHVGTYANIVISVSDGAASTSLPAFTLTVDPPANVAPTISGAPATSVTAGSAYSFTPSASDADGDTLTFSIQNRPAWATFSTSTGRLSGTPGSTHVGTYGSIVISVSDGRGGSAQLAPFTITVNAPPNAPPTISGGPATSVTAGSAYSFTPSASDADGDTLTFSIQNRPAWATFSTSTGRLSGTPAEGDVGTYANIVISVSDGRGGSAELPAFAIVVSGAVTGSALVSWNPPTQNEDGSPLLDLAGYRLYWGRSAGALDQSVQLDNAGLTSYLIENLAAGTWYFAVQACNSSGVDSALSAIVSKTIQ
jgi:hypothetical protein